jgi:uncharacterized alkaline shock family protein YloU
MTETQSEKQRQRQRLTIDENPSGISGVITLDENVVSTIAGLAARDVDGIHSVGRSRLISFGDNAARGVHSEVGKTQAAFDIDVVLEYGSDVRDVAKQLRAKTAGEVEKMAGREVVEINVHVVGIHLPEETEKARVRVL